MFGLVLRCPIYWTVVQRATKNGRDLYIGNLPCFKFRINLCPGSAIVHRVSLSALQYMYAWMCADMQGPGATTACERCTRLPVAPNTVLCQHCVEKLPQGKGPLATHPLVSSIHAPVGGSQDERATNPVRSAEVVGAAKTGDTSPPWPEDIFDPYYDSLWKWWDIQREQEE